jgi:hypothetical protein
MPNDIPNATSYIPRSRGWRRYHELRAKDAQDKQGIIRGLLDGLGRESTMAERIAFEQIASLTIWARVLERRGRFDAAAQVWQQVTQARRSIGMKLEAAPSQPPPVRSAAEDIAALGRARRMAEGGVA